MSNSQAHKYDLFISYAESDQDWVLGYLLPALGLPDERIITRQRFLVGTSIVNNIEDAVKYSQYTLLVLTPSYLDNEWTSLSEDLTTYLDVSDQKNRLIPILYQPCDIPLRISFRVMLDCTDQKNWRHEIARIRELLNQEEPVLERIPRPYPGIYPFNADNADFFYGRTDEIEKLLLRLRFQNFFFIIGPTGCGKSSLVFAGLVSKLNKLQPGKWRIESMRPGDNPMKLLEDILGTKLYRQSLEVTESLEIVESALSRNQPAQRLLLIIDQFEEVFTQAPKSEQEHFIQALQTLRKAENCAIILVMRADFYPDLMLSKLWPVSSSARFEIGPLKETALQEAITEPARRVGVFVEKRLVESIMADAADEPGAMPLVQETMAYLWEKLELRFLPFGAYQRLGTDDRSGLAVAMAAMANASLSKLLPEEQITARRIFLRLIQFGEGRADTRRQRLVIDLRSEGGDQTKLDKTLHHLANSRLLILSGEEDSASRKVDMAHEALITGWPELQNWIEANRDAEQTRRRLQARAEEWDRLGQDTGGLLDEVELSEAEQWLKSPDADVLGYSVLLGKLVERSRHAIEAALEEKRRHEEALLEVEKRRSSDLRRSLVIVASLLAAVAFAAFLAWMFAGQIKEQAKLTKSRQLGNQALLLTNDNLDLALLLASEAANFGNTIETRRSLISTTGYNPHLIAFLHGQSRIRSIVFSRDGQTLASAHSDSTIILWDVNKRQPLGEPLTGHTGTVIDVAFSPNGQILASASGDSTIILWDVDTHQAIGEPLLGHKGSVRGIAFSPSGDTLASASSDSTVILWNISTRRPIGTPFVGHEGPVNDIAFSPDGKMLASASSDQTIILLDPTTSQPLNEPLEGHIGDLFEISFSADGEFLLSNSGADTDLRLWILDSLSLSGRLLTSEGPILSSSFSPKDHTYAYGAWDNSVTIIHCSLDKDEGTISYKISPQSLQVHENRVTSVAFSPDGKTLASASDSTIILWDLTVNLIGHDDPVLSVAFSPDGKTLASASHDTTIILWDVNARQPIGEPLRGHKDLVTNVAFSPDGKTLASASHDTTIMLWNVNASYPIGKPLYKHKSTIHDIAFSPDGKTLASSASSPSDKLIILWDIATDQVRDTIFTDHTDGVYSIAFSPDGKMLASGGAGRSIFLWNVDTLEPLGSPLTTPTNITHDLVFSRDASILIASIGVSSVVALWEIETREILGPPLSGQAGSVLSIALSPDGKILASGSYDSSILLRNLDLESLADRAKRTANRELTLSEIERYLHFESPPLFSFLK